MGPSAVRTAGVLVDLCRAVVELTRSTLGSSPWSPGQPAPANITQRIENRSPGALSQASEELLWSPRAPRSLADEPLGRGSCLTPARRLAWRHRVGPYSALPARQQPGPSLVLQGGELRLDVVYGCFEVGVPLPLGFAFPESILEGLEHLQKGN